jgi:hypothetical protein
MVKVGRTIPKLWPRIWIVYRSLSKNGLFERSNVACSSFGGRYRNSHRKNDREEAIKYYLSNISDSEEGATAAIERYMAIPGQALGYKIWFA